MVAFTVAKVAVESLIKGISNEFFGQGIIANTIALATLDTPAEREIKPNGDRENWLQLNEVCELVEKTILQSSNLINGNAIQVYKYSEKYFRESYFDRIKGNE